jgi:hypothetical protein
VSQNPSWWRLLVKNSFLLNLNPLLFFVFAYHSYQQKKQRTFRKIESDVVKRRVKSEGEPNLNQLREEKWQQTHTTTTAHTPILLAFIAHVCA